MVQLLVLLLSLSQLNTLTFSESIDSPNFTGNNDDSDRQPELPPEIVDYPNIKTTNDETEIDFVDPISSVNIDYLNNAIILQFRKQRQKQFKQALDKNFMRFGKRQSETIPEQSILDSFKPTTRFERSNGAEGIRDSRGDNFMRFGRSVGGSKNLMRLGRSPSDFMRFGRSPSNFMRFGRSPSDFMRFGRSPSDFMRFGRSPSDFMRFGRSPSDFMRFGRSPSDFMRFGRSPSDFMRFGRSPSDFMRFGRSPSDFMRFGRASNQNLMRIGRSDDSFMRFGKADGSSRSEIDKNFMRFGRPDSFMRFGRSPSTTTDTNNSFMRFGKRQKDETKNSTTDSNHAEKDTVVNGSTEASTMSPFPELDNDLDSGDLVYLTDLSDSMRNDEN